VAALAKFIGSAVREQPYHVASSGLAFPLKSVLNGPQVEHHLRFMEGEGG